jgi:hypothetical protein
VSTIDLEEVEPGRWRVKKIRPNLIRARSRLPRPQIISDIMPETEQVDGRFYTSKSAFRAVGRALGLTEVGNEKPKPKPRATVTPAVREARRNSIKKAIERYQSGARPRGDIT